MDVEVEEVKMLQVEYNLKNPNNLWTKKYTV